MGRKKKPQGLKRRLCKNPHCSNWFQPHSSNHWYCRSLVCDEQRGVKIAQKVHSQVYEYWSTTRRVYKKSERTGRRCQWEYSDGSKCGEHVAPGNRFLCLAHFKQAGSES